MWHENGNSSLGTLWNGENNEPKSNWSNEFGNGVNQWRNFGLRVDVTKIVRLLFLTHNTSHYAENLVWLTKQWRFGRSGVVRLSFFWGHQTPHLDVLWLRDDSFFHEKQHSSNCVRDVGKMLNISCQFNTDPQRLGVGLKCAGHINRFDSIEHVWNWSKEMGKQTLIQKKNLS